jgi:hypothetical protein
VTCTYVNTQRGSITIVKDTVPNGPQDFSYTGTSDQSTGISPFSLDDDADVTLSNTNVITGLKPGAYTVTEAAQAGFDLTGLTCTAGGTGNTTTGVATITLAAGGSVTCTYVNTQRAHVTLVKTENGVAPTIQYTFRLTGGPDNVSITRTTDGTNLGNLDFGLVKPGNYTLCELAVAAGTHSTLEDLGGTVNATTGDICLDITLAAAEVRNFTIDNTLPGGGQRTIGYWKNWNTCSHDGAFVARADKTGNHLADEFLPQTLGTYVVSTCEQAVAILSKTPFGATKNAANNAAYNLASQLLAAELNVAAGAATCGIGTTITQANALLTTIGFDGVNIPTLTAAQKQEALTLASILDQYNNGDLC